MHESIENSGLRVHSLTITRRTFLCLGATGATFAAACAGRGRRPGDVVRIPEIAGNWWTIASAPDLGPLGDTDAEEVVDFSLWRAADGVWQLQACIRGTNVGGEGRLFYRWEGRALTEPSWRPVGIAMEADPETGETPGGLQAPFVSKAGPVYRLFYGDWVHICQAISEDGKTFRRLLGPDGKAGMFDEGSEANARDPMLLALNNGYVLYYAAHPEGKGAVYARTSADLRRWSPSRMVAAGGAAGSGPSSAECPFAYFRPQSNSFYLFRTDTDRRPRLGSIVLSIHWISGTTTTGTSSRRCRLRRPRSPMSAAKPTSLLWHPT